MGFRGAGILALVALLCLPAAIRAHEAPPSEQLTLHAGSAATWSDDTQNVILLRGPVRIALDNATLSADNAVVWLVASPDNVQVLDVQIALIGNAKLTQAEAQRGGQRLLVRAEVRAEKIEIIADQRLARDESNSDLYKAAAALREAEASNSSQAVFPSATQSSAASRPASRPARPPLPAVQVPIAFEAQTIQTVQTDNGTVAIVLVGGVRLLDRRPNNDIIELSADRAVLFTPLKSLKELAQSGGKKSGHQLITSAYLESDVRIDYVPAKAGVPEQRLTARRVYYEFGTDRAILTDAVIHTIEPHRGTPIVMRAEMVRQLATGEYSAQNVRLTNSTFAVPSYCLAADKLYMRAEPSGDPRLGERVTVDAKDVTFQAFDIPFFYYPEIGGEMTEHGLPLRGLGGGHSNDFGNRFNTEWGLFESLGQPPPRDIDANYRIDYFSKRGPGVGLNAAYGGGFLTDTSRQPVDFAGEFRSYFVYDDGADDLGRLPVRVDASYTPRGEVLWEHRHYFPDGWEAQARLGYVSDPTFLEQWFRNRFEEGPPHDIMGYVKHQEGDEAFTFGVVWQPAHLVTTSNQQQEQFEVDRLPEIGYFREGDSMIDDRLTLFSESTADALQFARSRDSLQAQGFSAPGPAAIYTPGEAAEGYTGLTSHTVLRADTREELDLPFSAGPLRVTPYVMGRFTQYSDSPQESSRSRGIAGAGARVTTQLWKVDPAAESELLDIHQIRHVITPEFNIFSSAMNVQRDQVFVYDPQVDAVNDISGAQFAIHQRWETKRGGPGQWRSVDLFTVNVEVNAFVNKPPKTFNSPYDFRGLFFTTYPEESVPRDSVNADASWRLSDNTILLGDTAYNLDRGKLQTLAVGLLVRRDVSLAYFIGNRYIADLNSNITSVHVDYQLTTKYLLDLDQEFDFTQGKNVYSSVALVRKFDTFYMSARYFFDETTNENGFSFNIAPMGFGAGLDTGAFSTFNR